MGGHVVKDKVKRGYFSVAPFFMLQLDLSTMPDLVQKKIGKIMRTGRGLFLYVF